jgi:hypothetical protein
MLLTGSSNQFITPGASVLPIAGYQFALNAPSSAGEGQLRRAAIGHRINGSAAMSASPR